jgi:hypothetical protein
MAAPSLKSSLSDKILARKNSLGIKDEVFMSEDLLRPFVQSLRTHSDCTFGGRVKVCITTQYSSVFACNPFICSGVAFGAAISK